MSLEDLIRACALGTDESAWEEFVHRFHSLIAGVACRTAKRWGSTSPAIIDDLIQETYLKLCTDRQRMLSQFEARHPDAFYGYLKVITTNVVHDRLRSVHSQKRDSAQEKAFDESITQAKASGAGSLDEMEKSLVLSEIDAVLADPASGCGNDRDRTIFWLYYQQGMTAQAIAGLPGVLLTVKGVESLLHRLTRLVRERLAERRCSTGAS